MSIRKATVQFVIMYDDRGNDLNHILGDMVQTMGSGYLTSAEVTSDVVVPEEEIEAVECEFGSDGTFFGELE